MNRICSAAVAMVLIFGSVHASELRTWSDATGVYRTDAKLLGFAAGVVKLKKKNEKTVSVPIHRLSAHDQEFVRHIVTATDITPRHTVSTKGPATKVRELNTAARVAQVQKKAGDEAPLLDDPEIRRSLQQLQEQSKKQVSKRVTVFKDIYESRWIRCGRFCRRWCQQRVRIGRFPEQRMVSETVSGLEDGAGWGNPSDPHLGFYEGSFMVSGLPTSAGARASHINAVAIAIVPTAVASVLSLQDQILTLSSTAFSPQFSPPGFEQVVRVQVKIPGPTHSRVTMAISLQLRNAATKEISQDKAALNAAAARLWNGIKTDLGA